MNLIRRDGREKGKSNDISSRYLPYLSLFLTLPSTILDSRCLKAGKEKRGPAWGPLLIYSWVYIDEDVRRIE